MSGSLQGGWEVTLPSVVTHPQTTNLRIPRKWHVTSLRDQAVSCHSKPGVIPIPHLFRSVSSFTSLLYSFFRLPLQGSGGGSSPEIPPAGVSAAVASLKLFIRVR